MTDWMIYGATGYTGRLIAAEAVRRGMRPILGGRGAAVTQLGETLSLPTRRFDLVDADAAAAGLAGIGLVLNCAGPFVHTARPMLLACLAVGAHYLDITGEIAVFEWMLSQDAAAKARGIVVCPGVGFDVIPTDCLARALHEALPDATELALGFASASGLSPGTAHTMVGQLPQGGRIRRGGEIVAVPNGHHARRIDFGRGETWAMTIPWGDVASAHFTTAIPDIAVYVPAPRLAIRLIRWTDALRPLLGTRWVQTLLHRRIDRRITGPDAGERRARRTAVWGEVRNRRGERRTARIETANGYDLTVDGALHVAQWVMSQAPAPGYHTPAEMIGWRLVEQLPGSGAIRIS